MRTKKYLGIDWGEKRIGLALGNGENKVATPFKVANNISDLVKIILTEKIEILVIGLPIKLSGENDLNSRFNFFLKILKEKIADLNLEIFLVDERLSSIQADTLKSGKLKQQRDSVSAMIILQNYFDYDKN